jgi:hypothetical protein
MMVFVLAQQNGLSGFLKLLVPGDFNGILVYIVIVMGILTLFMQGNKGTLMLTVFMAVSIMAGLIEELTTNIARTGASFNMGSGVFRDMVTRYPPSFANFFVGIIMFVGPLVVAGMTKVGKARPPAILAFLSALLFLFIYWLGVPHN